MSWETERYRHVIFFSSGICSYLTARRVCLDAGTRETVLLFCDTHIEDPDNYRFLFESAKLLNCKLITLSDGRTPWQVFADEKCLGNNFKDPCSRHLKRLLARRWVKANCDPNITTLYLGLSWYEEHRVDKNRAAWLPWKTAYPMCDLPLLDHCDMLAAVRADGLRPPRLYSMGFEHSNCGGFCVKAGKAHFRQLLKKLPRRYKHHEQAELNLQQKLGKPVTILTQTLNGITGPMSLKEFREYCEATPNAQHDEDTGGCLCMLEGDENDAAAEGGT
jgi:hypothetical protein